MSAWLAYLLAAVAGYLLGSIPFGLLLTRLAGLGDIRAIGSGNIGATNVLRTGHKGLAATTLLLDMLKGTAAVLLAERWLGGGLEAGTVLWLGLAGGLCAFLGHIYPVWLGFRGGKGVATYIGVLLGLQWEVAVAFVAIWIAMAILTRYSSLSALVASLAAPLLLWASGHPAEAVILGLMTAILIYKHRANIERLREGREPRIGAKT